jgi:TonB family protein
MSLRSCKVFASVVLLTTGLLSAVAAQSPANTVDWETLRPEADEFTVLMPKGSTFETSKEPYHKMELNTRTYLSKREGGPVFAVVSLSGIKSNPAMYTEMQRVNSYVDAFKEFFPSKLALKSPTTPAPVKLSLVGEKSLQGHPGREYTMSVGPLSGTVQVFATKKRFYAVVYLNSKKQESLQEEFVSSFVLPERVIEPTPSMTAQAPPVSPTNLQRSNKVATDDPAGADANAVPVGETKPEAAVASGSPEKRRPISGGVLNGKAIVLPKPEYPAEAKSAGVAGSVAVQVTVDEMGNVIEAKAVSGHPLLQQVSVNAAMQARFSPTSLMGEPVKVTGMLVYNFVRQ